jgi:hypothetical protein
MVDPFEIPSPFDDEPAGQVFSGYREFPSTLQAEPIIDLQSSSEPLAEPETEPEPEAVEESGGEYIGAQAAAELLGMNLNHLRQLTFQKKLTVARREGRRSLYSLEAINEYKESHAKP